MDQFFDLFGDPVDPHHGNRGRPRHKPTPEFRNRVMILLAFEWSDTRIASAIGITDKTLRKHYFRELALRDQARDKVSAAHLSMLWSAMRTGNVAAMKEFGRLMEKQAFEQAEADFDAAISRDAEPPALGKKATAVLAAETAGMGTDWGDDLDVPDSSRVN